MLIVAGTSHKFCPIEIREKLAFSKKKLRAALADLVDGKHIRAAVILSTCNRVEIYADAEDTEDAAKAMVAFLAHSHDLEVAKVGPYLYVHAGRDALRHLLTVACGIDSQITGEAQILEQARLAYEEAKAAAVCNDFLGYIFSRTLALGALARSRTAIASGGVSLGSVAVDLMTKELGGIRDKKILMVGTGKIARQVIEELCQKDVRAVLVASRTYEKAEVLALSIGAEVVRFDRLREKMLEADVVVSATACPHVVIKKEDIAEIMSFRPSSIGSRPFLLIDLAVPRDIDAGAREIPGVRLFCLQDLDGVIRSQLAGRQAEIPKVKELIEREVNALCSQKSFALEAV